MYCFNGLTTNNYKTTQVLLNLTKFMQKLQVCSLVIAKKGSEDKIRSAMGNKCVPQDVVATCGNCGLHKTAICQDFFRDPMCSNLVKCQNRPQSFNTISKSVNQFGAFKIETAKINSHRTTYVKHQMNMQLCAAQRRSKWPTTNDVVG